jgi:hypothetical protein
LLKHFRAGNVNLSVSRNALRTQAGHTQKQKTQVVSVIERLFDGMVDMYSKDSTPTTPSSTTDIAEVSVSNFQKRALNARDLYFIPNRLQSQSLTLLILFASQTRLVDSSLKEKQRIVDDRFARVEEMRQRLLLVQVKTKLKSLIKLILQTSLNIFQRILARGITLANFILCVS